LVAFGLLSLGEGLPCHVILHHGAFFKLLSDRVSMAGASHLEKLLKVIGRLPRLALDVPLDSSNELLIEIIGLLVIIVLVAAGCNRDPLGLLL
jgi:hypothetical protein